MRFMVTASDTFYERLKAAAEAAGMGISEFVRYCINRYMDDAKRNGVPCKENAAPSAGTPESGK